MGFRTTHIYVNNVLLSSLAPHQEQFAILQRPFPVALPQYPMSEQDFPSEGASVVEELSLYLQYLSLCR